MSDLWHNGKAPIFETKTSKSIIHPFIIQNYNGLAINPYQGCQHRCAYCYATYEWSPEFYDKIYIKSNAPEALDKQLATWKTDTIAPVMVSSATDPYQPAELRFDLTRKCVKVLQKYNVPYYVFTKSTIIERDLELHKRYRHSCFIVWSMTTCSERVRRKLEPGTPPADRIFEVIKKFTAAGVCCGVNVDPIIPLITDSNEELGAVVDSCKTAGLQHVFGSIMRLRSDIWERIKLVIKLLEITNAINEYKRIYNFEEPLNSNYVMADKRYAEKILGNLERKIKSAGMSCHFPDHMKSRLIDKSHLGQTTILSFLT
jgi:DNA repair photolyase